MPALGEQCKMSWEFQVTYCKEHFLDQYRHTRLNSPQQANPTSNLCIWTLEIQLHSTLHPIWPQTVSWWQRSSSAAFRHIKDVCCQTDLQQLWRQMFLQLQVQSSGTAFQLICDKETNFQWFKRLLRNFCSGTEIAAHCELWLTVKAVPHKFWLIYNTYVHFVVCLSDFLEAVSK